MTQPIPGLESAAAPPAPAPRRGRPVARVLGLDVSLRSTGVAGSLGWCERIVPGGLDGLARLRYVRDAVRERMSGMDLAVLEGAAFSRALQRGHDELGALRWWVRDVADTAGVPLAVAPSTSVKLYAFGKGRLPGKGTPRKKAEKRAVLDAMRAAYPGTSITGDDEADALAMAAMGADWLGYPAVVVPDRHRAALDGVAWPDQEVTAR